MKWAEDWGKYISEQKTKWLLSGVKEYISDYLIHGKHIKVEEKKESEAVITKIFLTENEYFERYYLKENEVFFWNYYKDEVSNIYEITFVRNNDERDMFEDLLEWKYQNLK